jgi:DNA ligase-1
MSLPKREFCLLGNPYEPGKHVVNGWFVSEKLDGQRALWLPHTRGDRVHDIPFANRERDSRDKVSTGLWSRYGKPIFAPGWWLDNLPHNLPLDGELYIARRSFQTLSSCVRKHTPVDEEWRAVRFVVFDTPSYQQLFRDGRIYTPVYKMEFEGMGVPEEMLQSTIGHSKFRDYEAVYDYLQANIKCGQFVNVHKQIRLPFNTAATNERISELYGNILAGGGEGIVFRKYTQLWEPIRSRAVLKMKPHYDDEGTVIGFTTGKGKLKGLFGNLILSWKGHEFELSGFTDQERTLICGYENEPEGIRVIPASKENIFSPYFKIGDRVTFKYRELSDKGIPKEARFDRVRHNG